MHYLPLPLEGAVYGPSRRSSPFRVELGRPSHNPRKAQHPQDQKDGDHAEDDSLGQGEVRHIGFGHTDSLARQLPLRRGLAHHRDRLHLSSGEGIQEALLTQLFCSCPTAFIRPSLY